MAGHFVFWTIVLIILELRIFSWVSKLYDKAVGLKFKPIKDLELDSDVVEEELRIEESTKA